MNLGLLHRRQFSFYHLSHQGTASKSLQRLIYFQRLYILAMSLISGFIEDRWIPIFFLHLLLFFNFLIVWTPIHIQIFILLCMCLCVCVCVCVCEIRTYIKCVCALPKHAPTSNSFLMWWKWNHDIILKAEKDWSFSWQFEKKYLTFLLQTLGFFYSPSE